LDESEAQYSYRMNSTNRNAAAEARGVPETDQLGGRVNRENSLTSPPVQGRRGGRRSRAKGGRIEREIVSRHTEIGIKGAGHDIDIYALCRDEGLFVAEVKSRRSGAGFVTLEKWLGEYDCLFLSRTSAEPMVLLHGGSGRHSLRECSDD
jgi:hypothetical protein